MFDDESVVDSVKDARYARSLDERVRLNRAIL
jgi:hypothetical protein